MNNCWLRSCNQPMFYGTQANQSQKCSYSTNAIHGKIIFVQWSCRFSHTKWPTMVWKPPLGQSVASRRLPPPLCSRQSCWVVTTWDHALPSQPPANIQVHELKPHTSITITYMYNTHYLVPRNSITTIYKHTRLTTTHLNRNMPTNRDK